MQGRQRVLAIAWMVTIATGIIAACVLPVTIGIVWYVAVGLAIATYRRVERTQHDVTRVGGYRAVFGVLLGLATITMVAGASSIVVDPATGQHRVALVLLATTNVLVAICAWRALVRPSPRRAALAGGLATIGEMTALIGDALLALRRPVWVEQWPVHVAVLAALAAVVAGMLGCIVALTLFRPSSLPEARASTRLGRGPVQELVDGGQ